MAKSILSTVTAAALICSYTSAAGMPDDTDSAQTLLRKSTRNLKDKNTEVIAANLDPLAVCEQMMKAQGMEHELQNALQSQRNTTTVTIAQNQNPGTITLKADGGIAISGYVKLPADIEIQGSQAGITFESGAVLDSDGHSITGPGSDVEGITLNEDGGMTISGNVKLTADIEVPGELDSGAAITLLDGAVLDCDHHSIANGSGSTTEYGIKVVGNGAQIKNCDVSGFSRGADVSGNHVSIENSLFRSNTDGIYARSGGSTLEVNGVTASDNSRYGIFLYNWEYAKLDNIETNGNMNNGITASSGGTLEMNGVTASDNDSYGIFLSNWEYAKLDNIETNGNELNGIYASDGGTLEVNGATVVGNDKAAGIVLSNWEYAKLDKIVTNGNRHGIHMVTREVVLEDITAEQNRERGVLYAGGGGLSFKGKNSLSNNGEDGLVVAGAAGATVTVDAKAKVAVNNNGEVGIRVDTDGNANFELAKKGSLDACYNNDFDWEVEAKADANFAGERYICDAGKISGDGPVCMPCM